MKIHQRIMTVKFPKWWKESRSLGSPVLHVVTEPYFKISRVINPACLLCIYRRSREKKCNEDKSSHTMIVKFLKLCALSVSLVFFVTNNWVTKNTKDDKEHDVKSMPVKQNIQCYHYCN